MASIRKDDNGDWEIYTAGKGRCTTKVIVHMHPELVESITRAQRKQMEALNPTVTLPAEMTSLGAAMLRQLQL